MHRMSLIAAFAAALLVTACGTGVDDRSDGAAPGAYSLEGERGAVIGGLGGSMLGGVFR